jgi:light-regulated signal transduction histidine kinase (bacteriophytochrome)
MKDTEGKLLQRGDPKAPLIGALRQRAEWRAEKRRTSDIREKDPRALVHALQARQKELENRVAELTSEAEAFSSSVSHNLREPLRHIEGFTRALMEDYSGRLDATARDYFRRIQDATLRMSDLINAMLRLSRLSSWQLNYSNVDLSALASSVVRKLRVDTPGRKVQCVIVKGAVAQGDAEMLRIVLKNLLGNAWKFTGKRPSAKIEFGTTRKGNAVYFVRDNGVGFDAAYADKLFLPLQRLHPRASFPGTGFGLATAKRIIELHGGTIWAEATVGTGATFYFTLPPAQRKEQQAKRPLTPATAATPHYRA